MGCIQSTSAAAIEQSQVAHAVKPEQLKEVATPSLAIPGKLTSLVYNDTTNPPKQWYDGSFLIPHEWLRREMVALSKSVQALPDSTNDSNSWKAEMLAQWIIQFFIVGFKLHHTSEDDIFVPMMIEKGCKIGAKKISKDHEALLQQSQELQEISESVVQAEGKNCTTAIANLKTKVPIFVQDMSAHLKEEEMECPKELKEHVSQEENDEAVQKILQGIGLDGLTMELPAILVCMKEWATESYFKQALLDDLSPPMLQLQYDILIPNYHSYYCAMRDAPTLAKKPALTRIHFDPSMLPPPPPSGADMRPPAH